MRLPASALLNSQKPKECVEVQFWSNLSRKVFKKVSETTNMCAYAKIFISEKM